jgi:hypothetical protein
MAILGGLCVAALALIGAGAAAQWTTQTTSSQTITAGNLSVVLSSPNAIGGQNTTDLTLPNIGPVGSSFISTPQLITITNNGTVTANEINLQVKDISGNTPGSALASEMSMCFYSDGTVVFNGLMSADEGLGNMPVGGSIAPTATDTYTVVFYAGNEDTGCGNLSGYIYPAVHFPVQAGSPPTDVISNAPELGTDAENGVDTVNVTLTYSS